MKIKDNGEKDDRGDWRWLCNLTITLQDYCWQLKSISREVQDAKEAKERTKGKPITVVYMDIIFL
ncbi:MAG: hypothetical protein QXW32_04140 [Nitrososphaerales archaeon]